MKSTEVASISPPRACFATTTQVARFSSFRQCGSPTPHILRSTSPIACNSRGMLTRPQCRVFIPSQHLIEFTMYHFGANLSFCESLTTAIEVGTRCAAPSQRFGYFFAASHGCPCNFGGLFVPFDVQERRSIWVSAGVASSNY